MTTRTTLQEAANKVGVDESAANLIANYLEENNLVISSGVIPPKVEEETESASAKLRVQPTRSRG